MSVVDFFIIGAPKCGTSALDSYLSKHPDIYMAPNEPNFFADDVVGIHHTPEDEYFQWFAANEGKLKGEASPIYIYSKEAVPRILKHNPDAKMIALVRDPVTMAASWHNQMHKHLHEDVADFEEAWRKQGSRKKGEGIPERCIDPVLLQYQDICSIGSQLSKVLELVPRENILVLRQDNFMSDTRRIYINILDFLGVKDDGQANFKQVNPSAHVKSHLLQSIIKRPYPVLRPIGKMMRRFGIEPKALLLKLNLKKTKVSIDPDFEKELRAVFLDEVVLLEKILGQNLPEWKA